MACDEDGVPYQGDKVFFSPKHFSPHLKIFICPEDTPDNVSKEIERSFSLFFSDAPSAANHIRIALEDLLTHLKIKRYIVKGKKCTLFICELTIITELNYYMLNTNTCKICSLRLNGLVMQEVIVIGLSPWMTC